MCIPFILLTSHLQSIVYRFIKTMALFYVLMICLFSSSYKCELVYALYVYELKHPFPPCFFHSYPSSRCGHSPVYRTREMSGRALVPFIMTNQVPQTVSSLLAGLPDCTGPFVRQNAIHGTLLQVSLLFAHDTV